MRELMRPGIVAIVENASLEETYRAMVSHGVHAILVVGSHEGLPLGWVTARGLLGSLEDDRSIRHAGQAITERAVSVRPSATARDAAALLSQEGLSHLLVARKEGALPEGVVSDIDIVGLVVK